MTFLWGAATSSHQIEGNNIHNDWWQWEQEGNIEGGAVSGRACDHWNLYKEDLRLAADLGLNSYRFSIEWSRVEPERGKWDDSAFEWYRELIHECERRHLLPMATLHHFTVPRWLAEEGGFVCETAPNLFAGFAKQVVRRMGSRVPLWCTLNEPNALVVGQYLGCYMPPATYDPKLASVASRNLLRAHVQAYEVIHGKMPTREGRWKSHPLGVGIAHSMMEFHPWRGWHPVERLCASTFHRFYNQAWPDAVTGRKQNFGALGWIPYPAQVLQARGRKTIDFLGVNYYTRVYVSCRPYFRAPGDESDSAFPTATNVPVGVVFSRRGETISDLGWGVHPSGLGRMLRFVRGYGVPIMITENGIADARDRHRPPFLLSHLAEIAEEIGRGADIRGYYHWSLLDNFEWVKGFKPRFGLFEVDYDTFERRERPSAHLLRQIIATHKEEGDGSPSLRLLTKSADRFDADPTQENKICKGPASKSSATKTADR